MFQQCFGQWLESLRATGDGESNDGEPKDDATHKMRHVAIDGKTLRRSHDKKNGLGPLHVVSAWASDCGIALGQTATAEKSNEITAIPELLAIIDVEDAVVTIDAAGPPEKHRAADRRRQRRLRFGVEGQPKDVV